MKTLAALALTISLVGCVGVNELPADPPPAVVVATPAAVVPTPLEQLLGPIALYPDALIALILPASTSPSDVVLAARYLRAGGDPGQVDAQPWDESVRALAHYPEVVKWMDENLEWTNQLGQAFAAQPDDVMNVIQTLRARAQAAGTLRDTPQQQVQYNQGVIEIVPTQPDVIYVPYYDPSIVYAPPPGYYSYPPSAFIGFSVGFTTGWWLSYDMDWHRHCVWELRHEERERYWREHHYDWNRHHFEPPHDSSREPVRQWRPPHDRRPPQNNYPGPGGTDRDWRHDRRDQPNQNPGNPEHHDRRPAPPPPSSSSAPQPRPNVPPGANLGRTPFVGPTLQSPLPQPLPTPQVVPPLPQAGASHSFTPPQTAQRPPNEYRYQPPSQPRAEPAPARQPVVVGPTPNWQNPQQHAPVPLPQIHMPPQARPPQMAAPRPVPAPHRIVVPAPAPQPAPTQQQPSSSQGDNDDSRRQRQH